VSNQLVFDLQVDNKQAVDSINAFFQVYEKGVDGMAKMMGDALGKPVEKKVTIAMEGGELVAKEVEKASKEVKAIEVAAKAMNGEFGKTPNALRRQMRILKAIQGDTKKFNDETGKVTGTWKRLQTVIDDVQKRINKMGTGGGLQNFQDKLTSSQISAASLMGAFNMLTGAVSSFVNTGMEMEVLFIQLQGFTGGVEEASDAYQRFVEIGQATPFTAKQVATAARTMMGFGIETDQAITQVEKLAIVASATGGELTHMARNMGQIAANQRAYTRDLMQFANQGIPIYQEIGKILDVSTQAVREMAEEGKIGFSEVSLALANMTKEGSAFQVIAEKMDRTFAAKLEAMTSAVESFAGNLLSAFNEFDAVLGGLVSGTMQLVIDSINKMANDLSYLTQNMRELAPAVAAAAVGMGVLVSLTIAQNWSAFSAAIKGIMVTTKLWTAAEWALASAKAVVNTLMGNFAVIALAAGAAATVAALAIGANAEQLDREAEALEKVNALEEDSLKDREKLAFATEKLTGEVKEYIEQQKQQYDQTRKNQDAAKKRAMAAIEWQRTELKAFKDSQKERRAEIKRSMDEEKDRYKDVSQLYKQAHRERMTEIDERYRKIFDSIDAELGLLDKKSAAEKALDALERKKLTAKLNTLAVGSEEWLQTKIRLEQMDKAVKREELLAKRKDATLAKEVEKKKAEGDFKTIEAAEKKKHLTKMSNLKEEIATLDKKYKDEEQKLKDMQKEYDDFFGRLASERFADHQEALTYMREQMQQWTKYGNHAIAILDKVEAKKKSVEGKNSKKVKSANDVADQGWVNFGGMLASGGPTSAGTNYIVNELGQEAFLSASGRLSKINAPSWGMWKAPSKGTVIPAHLTSQLDIPAGGVNINSVPSAGRSGAVRGAVTKAGDNIQNNVTIQAANPVQAANNVMTQLAKLRHVRYH